ncbi:MAG: hypothetical protein NTZ10_02595 [Candidatus Saganbacteria bacterium]|nr:hypothetical protein [Candidatus Saganbacteria bacterium]
MIMYNLGPSIPKKGKKKSGGFIPDEWRETYGRPKGMDLKNGIYFVNDATPAKNAILVFSEDVIHLKELSFFLIWRYTKTYTREYFEQLNGKMFAAFQDLLDMKRTSLDNVPGLFQGIVFGDKQYKFKQTFYTEHNMPPQFRGAKLAIGLTVDRVQGPSGNVLRNPQDLANAYKELKTIFSQELDYMAQNPAFNKTEEQPKQDVK